MGHMRFFVLLAEKMSNYKWMQSSGEISLKKLVCMICRNSVIIEWQTDLYFHLKLFNLFYVLLVYCGCFSCNSFHVVVRAV